LQANQKRRFKKTTDSHHGGPVAANLLDQDFSCAGVDEKWGVDISYVWTAEGWLYLAIVRDLFSRRIVGWAPDSQKRPRSALVSCDLDRPAALSKAKRWVQKYSAK
jgi:putative transposase